MIPACLPDEVEQASAVESRVGLEIAQVPGALEDDEPTVRADGFESRPTCSGVALRSCRPAMSMTGTSWGTPPIATRGEVRSRSGTTIGETSKSPW